VSPVPATPPRTQPSRIQIHDVLPAVEGGRWPVKRSQGDDVVVECDIVRDGHEQLRAVVRHRPPGATSWAEEPMEQLTPDRWRGTFTTAALGLHAFQVEAWVDHVASWRSEVERKLAAGQEDLDSEMIEGAALHEAAASRLRGAGRAAARGRRSTGRRPPFRRTRWRPWTAPPAGRSAPAPRSTWWTSTASAPGWAPGTSCSRARGAA
jgi:hypothetical protein